MSTLILTAAPTVTTDKISLEYLIDSGEKGRTTVKSVMNRSDATSLLPDKKQDAIAACTIWDACAEFVGQEIRADLAGYRAELKVWSEQVKQATQDGQAKQLVTLMQNKPVKPDLSPDVAERIAPFEAFLSTVQAAWSGARKHTLSVFGTGKNKGQVIWTGTLSSLTRRTPKSGVIAKGRRVR
jgi:hypothetical protein